ncbi:hypothetical protein [uncultured Abyssibacter sp.]|uniref:hypothetical protein n=1 Tax=uncultured Abyssibacter sp. TaxID=2320202 RepID=UPI0032B240B9
MLLDYAMATALGCAGMAGLFHLAGEVLTLQNQVFQYGAAELVLREVKTLAHLTHGTEHFSGICSESSLNELSFYCEVLDGWLTHLPNHRFETLGDGSIELSWQLPDGARGSLITGLGEAMRHP